MNDELTALAEAGAIALVTAMATDLWQDTRNTAVALFRRSGRRRRATIEAQLDDNATLVRDTTHPDEVRRMLLGYWTLELAALLRHDPSLAEPFARLAGTVTENDRAAVLQQTNTANDFGTVFAVQRGDQHPHGGRISGVRRVSPEVR